MIDNVNGGFYGRINGLNNLIPDAEKGIILNSRILWSFSAAFNHYKYPSFFDLAERTFEYMIKHFLDHQRGGVYWMLDYKGKPTESKKQIYAQAFAIYGLVEFYKASNSKLALDHAIDLYQLIEKHSFDKKLNGYIEALDTDWKPLADVRLSEKDLNAEKTMNTHLHILEAYTHLYRYWNDKTLHTQLKNLILLMMDKFISDKNNFLLFFDKQWNLLSDEISYGHDIEGSWLLYEAAEVLGDKEIISRARKVAIDMVDAAIDGMDYDGGMMNEGRGESVIDTDKHWWPQAEALVGFVNAWQLTGKDKYIMYAERVWGFILTKMVDHENGEWFWKVSREGEVDPVEDKAGPWKCPYHNSRALLEIMHRLS